MKTNAKTKAKSKASNEERDEYQHAKFMFIMAMVKIRQMKAQGRSSARIGFEMGLAYPYYETIISSKYLTSKTNTNKKMVLALCQEFDKDLDNILPMRKLLK